MPPAPPLHDRALLHLPGLSPITLSHPSSHSSRKLLNHLFEHKQWPSELKPKIKNYLYNFRSASSAYDMGLSSVASLHACTAEHHIDARLSKPDANLLTTGVIYFYFDAATKEMVLLLSSLKMTMFAIEEMMDGYSVGGQLMLDWTYGINKEKIPLMTMGICDVKQHGRLVCFGPTRFENTNTVRLATKAFKGFADKVANILVSGVDDPLWHPSVCTELRDKYGHLVDGLQTFADVDDDLVDGLKTFADVGEDGGMPELVPEDKDKDKDSVADRLAGEELQMHSRSLPPAQPAPPTDEGHAALESLLVPAMEKRGESPREAKQNATRTRASRASLAPLLPLAPPMRVGDDVEVADSDNSDKIADWSGFSIMTIIRMGKEKASARTCDLKCKKKGTVFKGIHVRHVRPLSMAAAVEHKKSKHHKKRAREDADKEAENREVFNGDAPDDDAPDDDDAPMPPLLDDDTVTALNDADAKAKDMTMLDGLAAEEVMATDAALNDAAVNLEFSKWYSYYKPKAGASDMADAIPKGCMQGIPSIDSWVACYAHVWRAVHKNLHKLFNSTDDRVSMLFTDLAFLHETSVLELWPHAVRLFTEKWGSKLEETVMIEYLQKEILHRRFGRCHTAPGKPTDTNTLEAFNRVLKTEQNFGSVEGMANVIEKGIIVGERMSRDYGVSARTYLTGARARARAQPPPRPQVVTR